MHYKVWDEITYSFLNFNDCTVEMGMDEYWLCDYLSTLVKLNHVSEKGTYSVTSLSKQMLTFRQQNL